MSLKIIHSPAECSNHLLVTHPGRYHPDEVIATVILYEVFDGNVSLWRTDKPPKNLPMPHTVYDVGHDVGYMKYDHHQPGGNGIRKNGVPYAAAGLIWRDFGGILLEKKNVPVPYIDFVWKSIDKRLIQCIDRYDNGFAPKECSDFGICKSISNFNPTWLEDTPKEEGFQMAFAFAKFIFDREVEQTKARVLARPIVLEEIEKSENGILVLERFIPWQGAVVTSLSPKAQELLYVITPSSRKGYSITGVPKVLGAFEVRKPFPESWGGLTGKILREVTGVETALFCHSSRFTASALTLEDAKKLAALAASYDDSH